MKKNWLILFTSLSVLTLSSCGQFKLSSISESSNASSNSESLSSIIDSSFTSDASSSADSSSLASSSSDSSNAFDHSSNSAISSASLSSSQSISSANQSSSSSEEQDLTPQSAESTYLDLYHNSMYELSVTPSKGEVSLIVIPIWFTDSSSYILESKRNNVRQDIQTAYFGSDSDTGWKSVQTYYEEESRDALSITGEVSDWYEVNKASTYYGSDDDTSKTCELVQNASNWYFTNNPSKSRKDFDQDQDGYLDGVMLIYAAPDQQASGHDEDDNYSNLWAYCYWIQERSERDVNNPGANVFFWASYDFMYGKDKAASRTGKSNSPYNGDTTHCNLDTHTYIHEMGHMFGLNDYYDYSGQYSPAGGFSMQDCNVGGHDPFSVYALGWGEAYIPKESITIELKPFATSGEMIFLSPQYNEYNSPFDEYLLLEYYTPTGLNAFDTMYQYTSTYYPRGSKETGIRLWHVDDRLYYENKSSYHSSFAFTTNPNDPLHPVAEAFVNTYDDGSGELDDYLSPLGSRYDNYNQLQLIHNNTKTTYKSKTDFSGSSLFKKGSSFDMTTYKKQFYNSGKLNQNIDLGFTFTVDDISNEYATITITKL